MRRLPGARFGLAVLAILAVALGLRFAILDAEVETDIQSILPQTGDDPLLAEAMRRAGSAGAAQLALAVSGGEATARREAATALRARLEATGLFVPAAADVEGVAVWIAANRSELACEARASGFGRAAGESVFRQARARVYGGLVPLTGDMLRDDPFLLQYRLWDCLGAGAREGPGDTVLVAGRLTGSAYRIDVQDKIAAAIAAWRDGSVAQGLRLDRAGAVFFAAAGAARARSELTLVGGASVLLLVLLYWFTFRSPRSVLLALATVSAGALGGTAAIFLTQGSANFTVFVFGSALTGVAADYAVHMLAARRARPDGDIAALRAALFRPLTISMGTSALGFAALLFFDIEVFRQIGLFAIGGLITAWFFALTVLPALDRPGARRREPPAVFAVLGGSLTRLLGHWPGRIAAALLVVGIGAGGLAGAGFVDDIRRFQPPPPALQAEQARIAELGAAPPSPRFLLARGPDLAAAQAAEERALAVAGGLPAGMLAYTRFDPPAERRAANRAAYREHLVDPFWETWRRELGLEASVDPLPPTGAAPVPEWLAGLRHEFSGGTYLIAPLPEGMTAAVDGGDIRVVDPAAMIGGVLRDYREAALAALAGALGLAALFVLLVYRRLAALAIVAPPAFGIVLGLGLPALLGVPLTLFSVLALFVVLGTGVDFSIFQWERRETAGDWTASAVIVAAATSVCAMGMLAFSATVPVQSFGATIAAGVAGTMIFSFLLERRHSGGNCT